MFRHATFRALIAATALAACDEVPSLPTDPRPPLPRGPAIVEEDTTSAPQIERCLPHDARPRAALSRIPVVEACPLDEPVPIGPLADCACAACACADH